MDIMTVLVVMGQVVASVWTIIDTRRILRRMPRSVRVMVLPIATAQRPEVPLGYRTAPMQPRLPRRPAPGPVWELQTPWWRRALALVSGRALRLWWRRRYEWRRARQTPCPLCWSERCSLCNVQIVHARRLRPRPIAGRWWPLPASLWRRAVAWMTGRLDRAVGARIRSLNAAPLGHIPSACTRPRQRDIRSRRPIVGACRDCGERHRQKSHAPKRPD